MLKNLRKFYYTDERLNFVEVRWVRMKLFGTILGFVTLALCVILLVNHLANDILGLGYNRVKSLSEENRVLTQQVEKLTAQMTALTNSIDHLNQQGNQLRLLVDLPDVDAATMSGGTGGAVSDPLPHVASDQTEQLLHRSSELLTKLNAEVKVQEQSYSEIMKRCDYNKGYFAALPALKPMDGYYSANGFGPRMHPVLGVFKTHEGLDIINDVGTPVYAAGDGTVEMAGQSGGGYGIAVVVNHGYGYQTLYAHLSKVSVRDGQHVKRGDLLAYSGKTGLVTGPHLHYEVRCKGICKNPADFFLDDVSAQTYRRSLASR
jgi:murein DD-endopeptidase MepM/ murein hydrolase activator NlpD